MLSTSRTRYTRWGVESRRGGALLTVLVIVAAVQALFLPSAGAAPSYVPISGSGSTWSSNALDQWRRNVSNLYGITVNFSANGSTSGRNDFKQGQVDFAVSEIPYGLRDAGVLDGEPQRAFGYMPIIAGGTSFMYNLKIGNKRVTNLRLSGEVITKIFTQVITNWSDPAIKADNPGLTLPARKIVPVVRSDGSGTTAQFSAWMASQYGGLWDDYCHRVGRNITPCGFTSFYPHNNDMKAQSGSQGVAGFVGQDASEGAITYVEYSYARNAGFPVAKVLNKANYYVEPKASSVAVALLQAKIRPDLTSDLSQVYVDPDPRAYPLSSYSYMIIPKGTEPSTHFTAEKGRTLSEFAYYFLCEGQQQADALGYSPLPINLVAGGVDQVGQIPGSTHKLQSNNLAGCQNPTVAPDGSNLLVKNAPQPEPCDLKGSAIQCGSSTSPSGGGGAGGGGSGGSGGAGGGSGGAGGGSGVAGGEGSGAATGSTADGNSTTLPDGTVPGDGSAAVIDPDTGEVTNSGATLANGSSSSGASAVPVSIDVVDSRRQMVLGSLAAVLLLALVLGPPLVARAMRGRAGPQEGPLP